MSFFDENGFAIVESVYSDGEIDQIKKIIEQTDKSGSSFRKSADLFAVRRFLEEIPEIHSHIFTNSFKNLIEEFFDKNFFVVKSIYFDKPAASNWFVSYHQDLTISVREKTDTKGYINWTKKQEQYAVQPPVEILENIVTFRIHLDDTDENNGALKVISGSHKNGIIEIKNLDVSSAVENNCCVKSGGVMVMKPLLLHSSGRTVNDKQRRVIHIEIASAELPDGMKRGEYMEV